MRRYLVVANQTVGGEHLLDQLRSRMTEGPCTFHVVVPASHPSGAWSEGQVISAATARLEEAMARFREVGAEVTGEVGDASPLRAVGDALIAASYDEIILSTFPPGPSRWLKQDVVHRIQRLYSLPVTHVVAESADAPT